MLEKGCPVVIGGANYNLVFTTAALLEITDRYGGIAEMAEKLNGPDDVEGGTVEDRAEKAKQRKAAQSSSLKEIPWLISTLANQGVMLENPKGALITPEHVGLHTSPKDIKSMMDAVMKAIAIGMGTYHADVETERDLVMEELDRKNVTGAAE